MIRVSIAYIYICFQSDVRFNDFVNKTIVPIRYRECYN